MIENAGIGVAMGQSTPVIKEIADYVTDDNNNEGVKKAIERYCQKIKWGGTLKFNVILQKYYNHINF